MRVVFTLPRWANAEAAAPEVLQRWHGYYRALRLHEDGHRDNGIEAAREIERSLRDLPAAEACAAIDQSASLAAKDILRKYNARDRDYDAQTRHGATQGATLP